MSSDDLPRLAPTDPKGGWTLSRARPLPLLVACGIVLSAAVLTVTVLVMGYLRDQTLSTSKAGLLRLDVVLAETADRSLRGVEVLLHDIAGRIPFPDISTPDEIVAGIRQPRAVEHLNHRVAANPEIAGVAFIGPQGAVIGSAGDWPLSESDVSRRDYFAALKSQPELDSYVGAPYPLRRDGTSVIPVAIKLRAAGNAFGGVVVAAVPTEVFEDLYRAVPLGADGTIALARRDGAVLAQFPPAGAGERAAVQASASAALARGGQGVFEEQRGADRKWRIDAVQPLAGYPLVVVVSRDGDKALIGWTRQAGMFGAFAICGVAAIGLMGFLVGRQIRAQNALAAIRAEKIAVEHARLVAEAELLKKERLSVLGQFTATVVNELRNPLSAIRNTLFTMREIATSSGLALDRPLARIQRSIARCDRIIGDLLEYIRSPELSRVTVNFDAWLHDVLSEHALPPAVTLAAEYGAGDAMVRIDADRIRRVLINLVDNAAQALGEMPGESSRVLRISVRSAVRDGALEVVVADTGPGIPKENLPRIFEPLFSTKSFGAGLGLATVKQIVVQHGGAIGVESEIGQGTRVSVRLPLEEMLKAAA